MWNNNADDDNVGNNYNIVIRIIINNYYNKVMVKYIRT